jgi:NADP-dependent 3-hydroxy acid dehydrogenase YdfG
MNKPDHENNIGRPLNWFNSSIPELLKQRPAMGRRQIKGTMSMTKRLEGKIALVTGASKGIGAEIAQRLAAEGASRRGQLCVEQARRGRCGGEDQGCGRQGRGGYGNLADPKAATSVVAETVKAFGPIDILVNNAGAL